jgi:hypothetical protein
MDIRLVSGEHKAALLVSTNEPPRTDRKHFNEESINQMRLQSAIK